LKITELTGLDNGLYVQDKRNKGIKESFRICSLGSQVDKGPFYRPGRQRERRLG
jgi:hypothetical protein